MSIQLSHTKRGVLEGSQVLTFAPPPTRNTRSQLSPRGKKLVSEAVGSAQPKEIRSLYVSLASQIEAEMTNPLSRKMKKRKKLSIREVVDDADNIRFSSLNKSIELYQPPIVYNSEDGDGQNQNPAENEEMFGSSSVVVDDESSFTLTLGALYDPLRSKAEEEEDTPMFQFIIREFYNTCFSVNLLYTLTEQMWTVFFPSSEATNEFHRIKYLLHCQIKLRETDPIIQLSHWILDHITLRVKDFVILTAKFNEKGFLRTINAFITDVKDMAMTKVQAVSRGVLVRLGIQRKQQQIEQLQLSRKMAKQRIRNYKERKHVLVAGEILTDYFHVQSSLVTQTSGLLGASEVFAGADSTNTSFKAAENNSDFEYVIDPKSKSVQPNYVNNPNSNNNSNSSDNSPQNRTAARGKGKTNAKHKGRHVADDNDSAEESASLLVGFLESSTIADVNPSDSIERVERSQLTLTM